ncbi:MAG: Rho-binding antiterminator [Crocinitomix sp.]|nr:Rho-binding antiterminator [Crocinitomix sp.]|tara:strand:- start:903 stop:1178 length:276 start_codon:yes stop_codon:yes gene_type:complete
MSTSIDPYQPINCVFHDYLEHFATLRRPIKIRFNLNGLEVSISKAIIYDLTGGRKGEYVHFKNDNTDLKVRMDHIISINNIEAKTFNSSYC